MCTGRRRELIVAFCLGVFLACADVYGQMADRTSVVINEISPSSGGDSVAWIEFFNPQEDPAVLASLVVRNGDGEVLVVPDDFADLPANGYLVVRFDDEQEEGFVRTDPSGRKIEVWARAELANTWIPAHGELSLSRPQEHALPKMIDHVAWGGSGENRSVPLAEGFGISDPAAHLILGESIGLYPVETGTPEHWVIYRNPEGCELEGDLNPCEVTPGLPNAIPRPKTFTPASGATVGANTVAFGWVRHPLDKGYRVEMARDPRFAEVMFSLPVQSANVRMGWPLEPGPAYFRVYALSGDIWSRPSEPYSLTVDSSKCGALPIMAYAYPDVELTPPSTWCTDLAPEECEVLESIEFKYQRKDSRLFCPLCPAGGQNKPHQSCMTFVLRDSEPLMGQAYFFPSQVCLWTPRRISRSCRQDGPSWWGDRKREGEHGQQYCVPASVSMIASAYGKCLSQDRIAYQIHSLSDYPWDDLGHNDGASLGGNLPDNAVLFALGLPEKSLGGLDLGVVNKFIKADNPALFPGYDEIKGWIGLQKPVMISSADHAGVIAGYCSEKADDGSQEQWLFVYDPTAGPLLVKAESVLDTTLVLWTFPAVNSKHSASRFANGDETGVWNDWDKDGIVDFDEALRFGTSPFCSVTSIDGTSDLATIQTAFQAAHQQWMDTGNYPLLTWAPWDPWMACPWPY